jgi:serine/threonine-protein kinase RsbW
MDVLRIQIPSLPENIRIVESFIDNLKDHFNIDEDIYGNLMVSITEAVNNAIKHGNQSDRSKFVSLTAECSETQLLIRVEDEGKGFDYQNLPDPTAPENLEKVGGRGIFLMRHLADGIHFEDEGRKVEMTFYFP